MITKVVVKITPMMSAANISSASVVTNPGMIGTCIDYDDDNLLTSMAEYEQYATWRVSPVAAGRTITRVIRPRWTQEVVGAATGYRSSRGWLDAAVTTTPHHGLKIYADVYGSVNAAQVWQVTGTTYFKCRSVR